jgi:hypothetical protein
MSIAIVGVAQERQDESSADASPPTAFEPAETTGEDTATDEAAEAPPAIDPNEDIQSLIVSLISGSGMILVGLAAVLYWWRQSHVQLRWFWVGAAVWTVGVFLKFAWAIPLNGPILAGIKSTLGEAATVPLGSVYIGSLTGVFEIGITLIAALVWKSMARTSARGVAVGVGAGAFEAILLGTIGLLPAAITYAVGGEARQNYLTAVAGLTHVTPLAVLVAPVERVIALLCHISSRTLLLWGVARGRWFWPFVGGFVLMSAVDTIAGYVHLAGLLGKVNVWWIELALAPFAVISIPITIWCIRHWPKFTEEPSEPHALMSGDEPQVAA